MFWSESQYVDYMRTSKPQTTLEGTSIIYPWYSRAFIEGNTHLRISNNATTTPLKLESGFASTIGELSSRALDCLSAMLEFMSGIGLKGGDFQYDVSKWVDDEVEGWSYLQLKVTLLESGLRKLLEREMDKFELLKSLIAIADRVLPREVRREVVVLVE